MIRKAVLERLYVFWVEHQTCPDPDLITKETTYIDDSIRVEVICPGCGGTVAFATSESEAEEIGSLLAPQKPWEYLQ